MLERSIELKRNPFFVFMLRVLPIIFLGGLCAIWAFSAFNVDVSKLVCFGFFVVAICFGINDLKNNNKILKFSDSGLSVVKRKKGDLVVEKFIPVSDILEIECNEFLKNIHIRQGNSPRYELLKYNSAHMLGAEKFFMVKAELCRYFPNIAHEYIDDEVKSYIDNGNVSEFVNNKVQTGRCQAGVLLFAELIFCAVSLGLSLLALVWVILQIIYYILLGLVAVLNLVK